jgi:hypothetical protein
MSKSLLNPKRCPERTDLQIVASDNDMQDVVASVRIIREAYPAAGYRLFNGYGHFCSSDMKRDDFPELLEIVVGAAPIDSAALGVSLPNKY